MRTTVLAIVACLLLVIGASAQKIEPQEWDDAQARVDCITDGYTAFAGGPGGAIPDDDILGLTLGPVPTAAGGTILDVIFYVDITHTWIGDLRLWLLYDQDCDGTPEVQGELLCRPGLADCPEEDCCGCSGNLGGMYGFDDSAASIEDDCPVAFPVGCYGPDYDSSGLSVFDGLEMGGCFYVFAADGAGGDLGTIVSWEVFVLINGTPVEGSTWGYVKALYGR